MGARTLEKCKTYYEGRVFNTNKCGDIVVINYFNAFNIIVQFLNTGARTKTCSGDILNGYVKDVFAPNIYNKGYLGCHDANVTRKNPPESYKVWRDMIRRCCCETYKQKIPNYMSSVVDARFESYFNYRSWREKQIGFGLKDEKGRPFALDKDILIKGNKLYSEDTCCFVPAEINALFVKGDKLRGEYPIGVSFHKARGMLRATHNNKHLGYFNTPEEAFYAYKQAKESYIKEVANKWKDKIDPRVYEALMNYQVEITD